MPEKTTVARARKAKRQGKAPSTQAGEFVREEIHHVRAGKHGARSARQAIAIGLSKARRHGVPLKPPEDGRAASGTRERARRDLAKGREGSAGPPSARRSRASKKALRREGRRAVSKKALSRQGRRGARTRSPAARKRAARKAARTRSRSRSSMTGSRKPSARR
jgi:hypothetical protein